MQSNWKLGEDAPSHLSYSSARRLVSLSLSILYFTCLRIPSASCHIVLLFVLSTCSLSPPLSSVFSLLISSSLFHLFLFQFSSFAPGVCSKSHFRAFMFPSYLFLPSSRGLIPYYQPDGSRVAFPI